MRKLLLLTTWSYKDGLIQSAVMPYLKILKEIDPTLHFFLQTSEVDEEPVADKDYITIISAKQHQFGLKKLLQYPLLLIRLYKLIRKENIDGIHAFCTPAGMLGYFLSKATARPLVVDSYEPHAESMVESGTWSKTGLAFKLLWKFEKLLSRRARAVISCTAGMYQYAKLKYGVQLKNFYVKPSCVDLSVFDINEGYRNKMRSQLNLEGKIVCVYVGKLGHIYLEEEIFSLFKEAVAYWGDKFRVLMLTSEKRDLIESVANTIGVDPTLITSLQVPFTEVHIYLNAADFAITPVKPVPSKRYSSPIKDGEYWATGLPVIIPANISDDSDIIEENNIGAILHTFDKAAYTEAIQKIDALLLSDRKVLQEKIRAVAKKYRSYDIAKAVYEKLYTPVAP